MTCACVQVLVCAALDLAKLNTPSYAEVKDDKWKSKADWSGSGSSTHRQQLDFL